MVFARIVGRTRMVRTGAGYDKRQSASVKVCECVVVSKHKQTVAFLHNRIYTKLHATVMDQTIQHCRKCST